MPFKDFSTLENAVYKPLGLVSRCVHFDDVKRSHEMKSLESHSIDRCVDSKKHYLKNLKVWWFGPAIPLTESQFYGNVSYEIEWATLLEKFGPNIYEIDTLSMMYQDVSRILITDADHSDLTKITEEKLHKDENDCYPIRKEGEAYEYAKSGNYKPHLLSIAVEDTGKDGGEWLFTKCVAKANDHSKVNEPYYGHEESKSPFSANQCLKFNTKKKECPYQLNLKQAEEILEEIK